MTSLKELEKFALAQGAEVLHDEPMAKHTTFKIGGPAQLFINPCDMVSTEKIADFACRSGMELLILGNGSNLLVSDQGVPGAVLHLNKGADKITVDEKTHEMTCESGAQLELACIYAKRHNLTGMEWAYGIPGTVGGAVYMNAGAYGGEIKNILRRAAFIGPKGAGQVEGDDSAFGYRHSPFTGSKDVVTRVVFGLLPGDPQAISVRMDELMQRRHSRQPLEFPSAGSVFKRPSGHYAGTMIEQCGLKGRRVGGAVVSEKHANFILNTGGATCSDVLALIDQVKHEVFRQTGIELESEIKMIGVG